VVIGSGSQALESVEVFSQNGFQVTDCNFVFLIKLEKHYYHPKMGNITQELGKIRILYFH